MCYRFFLICLPRKPIYPDELYMRRRELFNNICHMPDNGDKKQILQLYISHEEGLYEQYNSKGITLLEEATRYLKMWVELDKEGGFSSLSRQSALNKNNRLTSLDVVHERNPALFFKKNSKASIHCDDSLNNKGYSLTEF